jgi:hypothetical protein
MSRKHSPKRSVPAAPTVAEKKAAVLGTPAPRRRRRLPILLVALLAGGAGAFGLLRQPPPPIPSIPTAPAAPAGPAAVPAAAAPAPAEAEVTHALAGFEDGRARHFDHAVEGRSVRYFVVQSADGVVRAAFDACDVCWPAGKGYYQEGDAMVCRNCGRQFATDRVNEVQGGCNPAPLTRKVVGDRLVIRVDDIRAGLKYFDFQARS